MTQRNIQTRQIDLPALVVYTYTANQSLLDTHLGNVILLNSASAIGYTVVANATVSAPIGTTIVLGQSGVGQVQIIPAGGVVIRTPETLLIRKQHGKVTLIKTGSDTWDVEGNLQASP